MKVFFLSTGRSGSLFFYTFFRNYYPELAISHQSRGSRIINILGNLPLKESLKKKLIKSAFIFFKGSELPGSAVDPLISIPVLYQLKYKILKNKNIKIVHLIRDPRTFVPSFLNWKNSSFKRRLLHHFIPFWQPSIKVDRNTIFSDRMSFSKFKQFCFVWNYKNELIKKTFEHSNNYLLVRIEDITSSQDRNENLSNLIKFLELPTKEMDLSSFIQKKVNESKTNSFPTYNNWSNEQKKYLHEKCGKLMKDFGYE